MLMCNEFPLASFPLPNKDEEKRNRQKAFNSSNKNYTRKWLNIITAPLSSPTKKTWVLFAIFNNFSPK